MRLLDGFSRAGAVRLTGVLVAAVAVAACCVGVSSAAAEGSSARSPSARPVACLRMEPTSGSRTPTTKARSVRSKRRAAPSSARSPSARPLGVSSDGTHVWVTNSDYDPVKVRSVRSKRRAAPSSARSPSAATPCRVLGWNPRLGHERHAKTTVSEIEASSGTVIRTITVGSTPVACPRMEPTSGSRTTEKIRSVRSKRRAAPSSARSPSAATPVACLRMEPTSGSRTPRRYGQ